MLHNFKSGRIAPSPKIWFNFLTIMKLFNYKNNFYKNPKENQKK
jgi:hypothetical protein